MSRYLRPLLIVGVILIGLYGLIAEIRNRLPMTPPAFDGIVESGVAKDGIPSIDQPRFDNVRTADAYLRDDGLGVDLAMGSSHRFYPFQILVWHQIVNDVFAGVPIAVTYDPLCASVVVYDRTVNGTTLTFGTSGQVQNNNFLMYDRETSKLWNQILGTGLTRESSTVVSWKEFKIQHGDGEVLSRSTGAIRDYTSNPYGDYANNADILFPLSVMDGSRPSKEIVTAADGSSMYWFCFAAFYPGQTPKD